MSVKEHFVVANELRHHVVEWPADGDTVFLAHGFLDLAWSWKAVAEELQSAGFRCIAWDWRGHGESEHIGTGGYYHFPDYVLDLDQLVQQLATDRIHLVGHSMGGTVCTMFGGVRSAKLKSLTLIEGLGPPAWDFDGTPSKFEAWLATVAKHRRRTPRKLTVEECIKRMRIQNPDLPDDLARFLVEKSTHEVEGGRRVWRFDALHRTTSPMPFRVEVFRAFLKRISVPTLVVAGEKGFRLPDEADRYGHIPDHRFVEVPDVGHMIHWLQPVRLAQEIAEFIRTPGP